MPAEGQVVVDVAAAAVNFPDVLLVADQYQIHVPVPFTPGSEFAGTVSAVGPGVHGVAVGDRVMGAALIGAFAEQIARPGVVGRSRWTRRWTSGRLPPRSWPTARPTTRCAAWPESSPGSGSWSSGRPGEWGWPPSSWAPCWAPACWPPPRRPRSWPSVVDKGAEAAIDYRTEDLKERIKEITGGGAHVVIDPVGGPAAPSRLCAPCAGAAGSCRSVSPPGRSPGSPSTWCS